MITTVAFDLDDTLYDEIDYCKSGFSSVAEFLAPPLRGAGLANLPKVPPAESIFDALWKQFTAGNRTKTFDAAIEELGIACDDRFIGELVKVYRNHIPKITLPADSRDLLCRLSSRYTLALLTDGFLPAQQLKVQALGLEKYFECIVYTEQLGRDCWKPSPAGFEKLIETLNANEHRASSIKHRASSIEHRASSIKHRASSIKHRASSIEHRASSIAYIADNQKKDFIAPNKLGFLSIQIIRPRRIHTESSAEAGADPRYIIHKIGELPALLEKL